MLFQYHNLFNLFLCRHIDKLLCHQYNFFFESLNLLTPLFYVYISLWLNFVETFKNRNRYLIFLNVFFMLTETC